MNVRSSRIFAPDKEIVSPGQIRAVSQNFYGAPSIQWLKPRHGIRMDLEGVCDFLKPHEPDMILGQEVYADRHIDFIRSRMENFDFGWKKRRGLASPFNFLKGGIFLGVNREHGLEIEQFDFVRFKKQGNLSQWPDIIAGKGYFRALVRKIIGEMLYRYVVYGTHMTATYDRRGCDDNKALRSQVDQFVEAINTDVDSDVWRQENVFGVRRGIREGLIPLIVGGDMNIDLDSQIYADFVSRLDHGEFTNVTAKLDRPTCIDIKTEEPSNPDHLFTTTEVSEESLVGRGHNETYDRPYTDHYGIMANL